MREHKFGLISIVFVLRTKLHCLNMLRYASYEDYCKVKTQPWIDRYVMDIEMSSW